MKPDTESTLSTQSSRDIADWNNIADTYAQHTDAASPNPMYAHLADVLWDCMGELNGLNVLDLGCGDGGFCHMMQDTGANVIGIDGSGKLLDHARKRCPNVEFVQADLAHGIPANFLDRYTQSFDRILSTMILMDIPDLTLLMRDVAQLLTRFGRLVFVILHPCFFQYKIHFDEEAQVWYRKVTNYYDPQVWRIESFGGHNHYHRNLTYYTELLRSNKLAITRLVEPEWNPEAANPNAHVPRQWPICLVVEAQPLSVR